MTPRICIILINWNGWQDTIVGLDALRALVGVDFLTIVVDNGSTNDSVSQIGAWAAEATPPVRLERMSGPHAQEAATMDAARGWYAPTMERLLLVEAGENLGFARGNNLVLPLALASGADYVWLLNNDAATEPTTAFELARFLAKRPDYGAVSPVILKMGTSVVANCGGNVNALGFRRYVKVGAARSALPAGWIDVNYITGCAIMIPAPVLRTHGLLDERFFFGEEDFDFSHRLGSAGLKLACVTSAAVGHKFGASSKRGSKSALARSYIFFISRFVGNRERLSRPLWHLHRLLYLLYALPMLRLRYGADLGELRQFARLLMRDSMVLDGVNRDYFERLMQEGLDGVD